MKRNGGEKTNNIKFNHALQEQIKSSTLKRILCGSQCSLSYIPVRILFFFFLLIWLYGKLNLFLWAVPKEQTGPF